MYVTNLYMYDDPNPFFSLDLNTISFERHWDSQFWKL